MNVDTRSLVASPPASDSPPSFCRSAVLRALEPMRRGRLTIVLPDGGERVFGTQPEVLPNGMAGSAVIRVRSEAFFRKCVLSGDIGLAESYMDGDWASPDIAAVIAWAILNVGEAPTMSGSRRGRGLLLNLLRFANRMGQWVRPNSRANARRNISEHYDLSNDFFSLFLDPSMMYSAALWTRADLSLEEAQAEKNEGLCRHLRLKAGDHVLEIGTGWGGWALHAAARHGCRVTTVTISREQFNLASRRVSEAGLSGRVEVRLQDFRDIRGRYDKIVSIEMMEALGHRYVPVFCEAASRLLKADGIMALQFITCPDSRYEQLRRGVDFIQKHVFPGSLLLSVNRVNQLLAEKGGFTPHALSDFGPDYARTLALWHDAFQARLPQVRALGFSERFILKWEYYLKYCEAAFAMRNISVVHAVYSRPNNPGL